jgi:hypothetical protein
MERETMTNNYLNDNNRSNLFRKYNPMYATEEILKAYKREGHESFNITGPKGVGKTTYAMVVMAQIFYKLDKHSSADTAWDNALDHLLFAKDDVINFLESNAGEYAPVFTWDDLRAHASGMSYTTDPKATIMLLGLVDTMRDSVCGFLTTSPSLKGVLSFIAKSEGYHAMVYDTTNFNEKQAVIYNCYTNPLGQNRIKKVCTDIFPRFLPPDIYEKVKEKRSKYKDIVIQKYKDYMNSNRTRSECKKTDEEIKRYEEEIKLIQEG